MPTVCSYADCIALEGMMKREDVDSALTENVAVRVSKKERGLLSKYADIEAMKIIFNSAKRKLADRFTRKFQPFQREKATQSRKPPRS
jgi:hypothetical protein